VRESKKTARVTKLPSIDFIGAGALASSMARSLSSRGYSIEEFVVRKPSSRVNALAKALGATVSSFKNCRLGADIVWLGVPDDAIERCAKQLAKRRDLRGKIALHSSGALGSDVLDSLRRNEASVASLHPMMSFSASNRNPDLRGVSFSVEGDPTAVRVARRIVERLGGDVSSVKAEKKALYHAFGAMIAPLLVSHLQAAQLMGERAGFDARRVRSVMKPIVEKVVAAFLAGGAENAFSGPFLRGDVKTVERHLVAIRGCDEEPVYRALAEYAIDHIKGENKEKLRRLLEKR
jgi:predicted short-subunit dehydrogenase-like oxidoreductase (DUF2520 family)